jgi:hypothetical protein
MRFNLHILALSLLPLLTRASPQDQNTIPTNTPIATPSSHPTPTFIPALLHCSTDAASYVPLSSSYLIPTHPNTQFLSFYSTTTSLTPTSISRSCHPAGTVIADMAPHRTIGAMGAPSVSSEAMRKVDAIVKGRGMVRWVVGGVTWVLGMGW